MPSVEDNLKKAVQKQIFDAPGKTFYKACYTTLKIIPVEVTKMFSRTYEDFTGRKFHKETTYEKLCTTELKAAEALVEYCHTRQYKAQTDLNNWQVNEDAIRETYL